MTKDPHIQSWTFKKWQDPTILASSSLFALAIATAFFIPGWLTTILLVLTLTVWIVILYFFRDPDRAVLDQPGLVVGPGDGEVVSIELLKEVRYLKVDTIRISIFLSLFDVHVQRAPLAGKVTLVEHQHGKFLQAFRPEASDVNEYIAMQIDTPFGNLLVKQIAGILARRCINYAQSGSQVRTGQRYGLIKFGSRVDLFLPPQANVLIEVGDKVYGGLTPIAQLPTQNDEQV
jgi:phosphatidylserine decarboxylase